MYKSGIRDALLELLNESVTFWERWGINASKNSTAMWIEQEVEELQQEIAFINTPEFDYLRTAQEAVDVIVTVYAGIYARKGPEITRQWAFEVANHFISSSWSVGVQSLTTMKMPPTSFGDGEYQCKRAMHLAFSILQAIPDPYIEEGIRSVIKKNHDKNDLTHERRTFIDSESGEEMVKVMRRNAVVTQKDIDGDTIQEETKPMGIIESLINAKKNKSK